MRVSRTMWAFSCLAPLLVGSTHFAAASTILIDDFSGGDDEGWSHLDTSVGQTFGPGIFDSSAMEYRIGTSGEVPPPGAFFSTLGSFWDASSDPKFSNGVVRAKFRLDTVGSLAWIGFRFSSDPETGFSGYGLFASSLGPDGTTETATVYARKLVNGVDTFVGKSEIAVGTTVGEDWWMEAGGVDDQLSIKVWRVGDPEPVQPQYAFTDSSLNSGQIAVGTKLESLSTEPARVAAIFDDIYFISGDYDANGLLDADDLELLAGAIRQGVDPETFDLTFDGLVDVNDLGKWVKTLKGTWIGDSNLDGEFNSGDLVDVFQAGKYELDIEAGWAQGDWTADGRFGSADLVLAFQDGGYELGPMAGIPAVPEPSSAALLLIGMIGIRRLRQHR